MRSALLGSLSMLTHSVLTTMLQYNHYSSYFIDNDTASKVQVFTCGEINVTYVYLLKKVSKPKLLFLTHFLWGLGYIISP